jgi:hypothetical protein
MAALVCMLLLSASGATAAAVPRSLLRAGSTVAAAGTTPLVTRNVTFDNCCKEQPICCRYPASCCL